MTLAKSQIVLPKVYFLFNCLNFGASLNRHLSSDARTILGGLMSSGSETIISSAVAVIAFLAPEGQAVQDKTFEDILSSYSTMEESFDQSVSEEKSSSVAGVVR
ncbi:uncharacterized protein BCR38DRAFT_482157 [Pseudomassariella vexata]|uniref:Cytochrome P450 n=1 Tax=Pseudomassariella vexata TaxID=1141098 RepID=A0A1Y2EB71_9PEZI|nr:uncharacterized protein BCR38DRAFT_482157 [Pseudomassariella vexata]ORY68657.1 hypothetical protein BCR38DRAFT_482157 [Pseudomassariella vexata]